MKKYIALIITIALVFSLVPIAGAKSSKARGPKNITVAAPKKGGSAKGMSVEERTAFRAKKVEIKQLQADIRGAASTNIALCGEIKTSLETSPTPYSEETIAAVRAKLDQLKAYRLSFAQSQGEIRSALTKVRNALGAKQGARALAALDVTKTILQNRLAFKQQVTQTLLEIRALLALQ